MAFRLIPREERFYDDFVAMARQIRRGAGLLDEMLAPERPIWDKAEEIKEVEHECDTLTHQIIQRLHRTFVTPLDREDIFGLARSLDAITDYCNNFIFQYLLCFLKRKFFAGNNVFFRATEI